MNTSKIGNLHIDLSSALSSQQISDLASEMSGMNDDDFFSTWKTVGMGNIENAISIHKLISGRIVQIMLDRHLSKQQ